jgi:hypothetical protein
VHELKIVLVVAALLTNLKTWKEALILQMIRKAEGVISY